MNYKMNAEGLNVVRLIDSRLVSYNIEMTEITGGTFWKKYTPEQISGEEAFPSIGSLQDGFTALSGLMQYYPPIDLDSHKLRRLAKGLGPVWVRVSGTWATKTYYDFDGLTRGVPPAGYASVLTRQQWLSLLDFVKQVGAKLLISISNCAGDHPYNGPLDLSQAKKIFELSHGHGVDIAAIEFMNEPNMLSMSGAPENYTAADYARDQDILYGWVKENYPDCLLVGPCTTGDPNVISGETRGFGAGIASMAKTCTTEELLAGTKIPLDVFSYHYYNGVSERLASVLPEAHWPAELAASDEYLAMAQKCARKHAQICDRIMPGSAMWVTESGDAGGGGNTWAPTYLDVLRTLNELGSFSMVSDGVIFHNTLASSDYGFLDHESFEPRPNYYAVLLWNRLMGQLVYDCKNPGVEGAHVYCHSRRDKKDGLCYLVINNSECEPTTIELPKNAKRYTLSADSMRSSSIRLNGRIMTERVLRQSLEDLAVTEEAGIISLAPGSCTFLVI